MAAKGKKKPAKPPAPTPAPDGRKPAFPGAAVPFGKKPGSKKPKGGK